MSLYTAIQILNKEEGRSEKKKIKQSGTLTKRGFKNIRKSVGQLWFYNKQMSIFFFKLVFIKFRDYHHARLIKSTVICWGGGLRSLLVDLGHLNTGGVGTMLPLTFELYCGLGCVTIVYTMNSLFWYIYKNENLIIIYFQCLFWSWDAN